MRIDRVAFVTAMARADLNVKELAEKTGLSRVTITSIKGGKSCSTKTAHQLISVLGEEIISNVG